MADFDDRSGIVAISTDWGRWYQTIDDVYIEINLRDGTKSRDIKCEIKPRNIRVTVVGEVVIDGKFPKPVHADEAIWTLEDKKFIRICLPKSEPSASNCWQSLLLGQYEASAWDLDSMQRKLTLQRFQYENPGMDFSSASISGNYDGGGPVFEQ